MKTIISLSASPKLNIVRSMKLKSGKTITVGDSWRLRLPADDEYAQSRGQVGYEFNVIITQIHKNGEFTGLGLDGTKLLSAVYDDAYLKKQLHKSVLGK